jgi:hypothetical protein
MKFIAPLSTAEQGLYELNKSVLPNPFSTYNMLYMTIWEYIYMLHREKKDDERRRKGA